MISIHAPREGSDHPGPAGTPLSFISIHAPREGSDRQRLLSGPPKHSISIHAPREGSDSKHIQNAAGHFG